MSSFRPHPALRQRLAAIDVIETGGRELAVLPSAAVDDFVLSGEESVDTWHDLGLPFAANV